MFGWWWLRSPGDNSNNAANVNNNGWGNNNGNNVNNDNNAVRPDLLIWPVIHLKLGESVPTYAKESYSTPGKMGKYMLPEGGTAFAFLGFGTDFVPWQ